MVKGLFQHVSPPSPPRPEPLSRSLEQLSPEPSDRLLEGIKAFSTPGATPTGTPTGTPKMPRSWSKTKLGRRGSGPDPELEGAREFGIMCMM